MKSPTFAHSLMAAYLKLTLEAAVGSAKTSASEALYTGLTRLHRSADSLFTRWEAALREGQKGHPSHAQLPHHRQL